MLFFFWVLFSLGVAYAAKISHRHPGLWFAIAVALSPLVGSVALYAVNRWSRPT